MPELQELVSLISPYEATTNPTGSKRVVVAEEVASEPTKKTYQIIYTLDDGNTYDTVLVEIYGLRVGTNKELWIFKKYPLFLNKKNARFAEKVAEQADIWWASTGKDIYVSRSAPRVVDADLKYGMIDCVYLDGSTPPKFSLKTVYIIKTGASSWTISAPE